jgi:tetratricopeptide (TPR) repeat protein
VAQASGDLASARSSFEKGLELIKALAEEDPGNASLQRALAIAYDELGEVAQAAGDLAAARSFFEKELEVSQALAEADPRNSEWQFDLTISHMSLLTIARETQDGAAFRLHRDAMKQILERLEQLEREGRISEGSRLEALRQQYLQESAEPPPD